MSFDRAQKIADAILYEGYVLYPYRASSAKNRVRWQWGVLAPRDWSEAGGSEAWWMETQCLVEAFDPATIRGKVRFLHVEQRSIERAEGGRFAPIESLEVDGQLWTSWDEASERAIELELDTEAATERSIPFAFAGSESVEPILSPAGEVAGRAVRRHAAIAGEIRLQATRIPGPYPLVRVRVRIENRSDWSDLSAHRDEAMRAAFIGVHTLLETEGAGFVSLTDPPEWAAREAKACANVRTWPILAGEADDRTLLLSSPIILADHPEIAPESPGDLYDATEIDEILSLRTMTLTDEEKREARATDPRAAAILDRVDSMPPEILERLHGAIRTLRPAAPGRASAPAPEDKPPWWDPGADASVSPETDAIEIGGVTIARGARVRLRPGPRRADAQDMFLAGKTATVAAVFYDVDDKNYLAVTLEDDPAADLHEQHGRYLYFAPDEVEPLAGERT